MNNDRLKFRAFLKPLNELVIVKLFILEKDGTISIKTDDELRYKFNQDEIVIEQCTGMEDKNGKLIFEGDIYNQLDVNGEIISSNNICKLEDFLGGVYWIENNGGKAIIEIIGNVHEEPSNGHDQG